MRAERLNSGAAPATVSGERRSLKPLTSWAARPGREGGSSAVTREPGDRPASWSIPNPPVGRKEVSMSRATGRLAAALLSSLILPANLAHAQAAAVRRARHRRHADAHARAGAHDRQRRHGHPARGDREGERARRRRPLPPRPRRDAHPEPAARATSRPCASAAATCATPW